MKKIQITIFVILIVSTFGLMGCTENSQAVAATPTETSSPTEKVTEAETFRIGNIGEIYKEDITRLCEIVKEFLEEYNHE